MIKFMVTIVFLAELVIFYTIIKNIVMFNIQVRKFDREVTALRFNFSVFCQDLRALFSDVDDLIFQLHALIKQKKEEYSLKILKTSMVYLLIFSLRGKYKKTIMAYQLLKEVYEGILEEGI